MSVQAQFEKASSLTGTEFMECVEFYTFMSHD
jgi:hypothetical protein